MDQITNLNNNHLETDLFVNINQSIKVSGNSGLYINNQNSENFTNDVSFELEPKSSLNITLFDINSASNIENKICFNLSEDAKLNLVIVSLNTGITKSTIVANLNEERSDAKISVISVANSGVDTRFNVICNNYAPHTKGNIVQRAVALDGGSNVFEATGYIHEGCFKAVNFQESRVLLLDGAAKGDASPILLINHHDVEAGHAAGVSRVSDEEMYYLMSRGIDRKTAEELMTVAFIRPVIDQITNEQLRESVFDKISKKASYENN